MSRFSKVKDCRFRVLDRLTGGATPRSPTHRAAARCPGGPAPTAVQPQLPAPPRPPPRPCGLARGHHSQLLVVARILGLAQPLLDAAGQGRAPGCQACVGGACHGVGKAWQQPSSLLGALCVRVRSGARRGRPCSGTLPLRLRAPRACRQTCNQHPASAPSKRPTAPPPLLQVLLLALDAVRQARLVQLPLLHLRRLVPTHAACTLARPELAARWRFGAPKLAEDGSAGSIHFKCLTSAPAAHTRHSCQ